jgi:hypothetical protein
VDKAILRVEERQKNLKIRSQSFKELARQIISSICRTAEGHTTKVWLYGKLESPIGLIDAELQFHRNEHDDSVVLLFDQSFVMKDRDEKKDYDLEKIELMYSFAESIFELECFEYGWIQVEDCITTIRNKQFVISPPVDWIFVSNYVLAKFNPRDLTEAKRSALETKELKKTAGIFWKWSLWGKPVSDDLVLPMSSFRKHLSQALKGSGLSGD